MSNVPASPEAAPQERYRGERVALLNKVPAWARRAVVAGSRLDMICGVLQRAWNMPVCAIECDPACIKNTAAFAEQVLSHDSLKDPCPFPVSHADVVLILDLPKGMETWQVLLDWSRRCLSPEGAGILFLWDATTGPALTAIVEAAQAAGYLTYQSWPDPSMPDSRVLVKFVSPAYSPIARAKRLHADGQPDLAYNELMEVPQELLDREGLSGEVHALALHYLADVAEASDPDLGHGFILRGQGHFVHTTRHAPDSGLAAEAYARILQRAGACELAYAVRSSFRTAHPHAEGVTSMLPPARRSEVDWSECMSPKFQWPGRLPRILFLTSPAPHYGLDVLYDGLCTVLGVEQVTEWPYKPSLHGAPMHTLGHYPCSFHWNSSALSYETILEMVREGAFDVVLLGDCDAELPANLVAQILKGAADNSVPVALVDAADECMDLRPRVYESLGAVKFDLYFKREMARFIDYGPDTIPLPFSYSRSKIRPHDGPRTRDFFWAGVRQFGLRRLYLDFLESARGMELGNAYPQDLYAEHIASSRIGLSLFGKGYDTVRYWELPAHGCMLLSEHLPIHVPFNFTDGKTAVFFESLNDLLDKLDYYRAHPEESSQIAEAGERHFLEHHTAEARSRQLLHVLHERCIRNPA